uniref:Uncharacterized protein n=1 Tax=Acrobeloides nanus TaxID=290746 RepID=A0A914D7Z9_9BILA
MALGYKEIAEEKVFGYYPIAKIAWREAFFHDNLLSLPLIIREMMSKEWNGEV